ncbi:MAG: Ig-like domain-containing protein [Mogibacterium sp.]|nr:Ig-like domain-containing protein [Mogibacterium sp.]
MTRNSSMMRKLMVLMMAFAIMLTYSVVPMNQSFAASGKKPTKITLNAKSKTLTVGQTFKAKVKKVKPSKASKAVKWKSSNKKVATVSSKGVIKAKKAGKATITAVSKKNKKAKAKIKVTVKAKGAVKEKPQTVGALKSRKMTVNIDMSKYQKGSEVEVWVPVPQNDEFQTISNVESAAATAAVKEITTEAEHKNKMLHIKWDKNAEPAGRTASLSFTATRAEVGRPAAELKDDASAAVSDEASEYINKESAYVKVNNAVVKNTAKEIVSGKSGTVEKARAIYEWVIANLERIDNGETLTNAQGMTKTYTVMGCGYGDTVQILTDLKEFGRAGGHCTDINSTFVALCRAAGIPAREMFGIRLGDGEKANATGFQHCWAEFYLPGTGWVYADPADVLKAIRPGSGASVEEIAAAKASELCKTKTEYFWGHVDNNRIVLSRGRDITFNPAQQSGPCNTFGYPCAEVDGKRIECTDAKNFVYTIETTPQSFKDMTTEEWSMYGIDYSDIDYVNDYFLDVRANKLFNEGHLVTSNNVDVTGGEIAAGDAVAKALDAAYEAAAGKRIVVVCNSGNSLAKRAMDYFSTSGKDMSNVVYLKGGANGVLNGEFKNNMGITAGSITNSDYVIDVRPDAQKTANGYVPGAAQAPVSPVITDAEAKAVKAAYDNNGGSRVVIVCVTGNKLARNAMAALKQQGADMSKVTYLIGGFNNSWSKNYPVVSGDKTKVSVPAWVTQGDGPDGKLLMLKDASGNLDPAKADLTHHILVNKDGSNAKAALLNTKALPLQTYNALTMIGGKPYDKFNKAQCFDSEGKAVSAYLPADSQKVNVSFEADGKTYELKDFFDHVVTQTADITSADSVTTEPYEADMRFGGCMENINNFFDSVSGNQTGCITCTFSCWIGTVSNGKYAYNTQEAKVNRKNVPAANTPVTVVYTLG